MFEIQKRGNLTVKNWYRLKEQIWVDPPYQRQSDIWPLEKKQMLIDTIINAYDIPKLYLHDMFAHRISSNDKKSKTKQDFRYAIIDGKQRFSIIFDFFQDKFTLSDDFEYLKNPKLNSKLQGQKYSVIKQKFPEIIEDFESYLLDVIYVITDEEEQIDELFLRLNEGAPLNAQEKRVPRSRDYAKLLQTTKKQFRLDKIVGFSNKRASHDEIITKVLLMEHKNDICDLKKIFLDSFVDDIAKDPTKYKKLPDQVGTVFSILDSIFSIDYPIKSRSMFPVYYWFCKNLKSEQIKDFKKFHKIFEKKQKDARSTGKTDSALKQLDPVMVEFNRLNQQGTNDIGSILRRYQILSSQFKDWLQSAK